MPHVPEQTQTLAQRTTWLLHSYSCRRSHCQEAPEEHLEVWEQCGDRRSGTTFGNMLRKRNFGAIVVFQARLLENSMLEMQPQQLSGYGLFKPGSTAGAFLREEPAPAHLAWSLGKVGLFLLHLIGAQMHSGNSKHQAQPALGTPSFAAPVGVSEPDCLGHLFIDFLQGKMIYKMRKAFQSECLFCSQHHRLKLQTRCYART